MRAWAGGRRARMTRPRADLAAAKARVVLTIRRAVQTLDPARATLSLRPTVPPRRQLQPERLIRAPDVPIEAAAASRLIPYRRTTRRSSRPPPRATLPAAFRPDVPPLPGLDADGRETES